MGINMKNSESICNGKNYKIFIKKIFGIADEVCFVVDPFLDNLEELCTSGWETIYDSALYFDYQERGTGDADAPQCVLHLKADYFMMEFFLERKGIFDFDWRGKVDLMLVDPFFLKDGNEICSTITHEKIFWAREDLLIRGDEV